jgi:geranylgeranyl pyrophosphate synthase
MIEGEIIAIEKTGNIHITREEALEIIRRKTADLFSAACSLPAHFAPRGNSSPPSGWPSTAAASASPSS